MDNIDSHCSKCKFSSKVFNYLAAPFIVGICLMPIGFPASGMGNQVEARHLAEVNALESDIEALCVDTATGTMFPWNKSSCSGAKCSPVIMSSESAGDLQVLD